MKYILVERPRRIEVVSRGKEITRTLERVPSPAELRALIEPGEGVDLVSVDFSGEGVLIAAADCIELDPMELRGTAVVVFHGYSPDEASEAIKAAARLH